MANETHVGIAYSHEEQVFLEAIDALKNRLREVIKEKKYKSDALQETIDEEIRLRGRLGLTPDEKV
jgi:hypothetical protein